MFKKKKVYAYEMCGGDKGIIIAKSINEAKMFFCKEYPECEILDNDDDYCKDRAYLFEMDKVENNKLYCCFPW